MNLHGLHMFFSATCGEQLLYWKSCRQHILYIFSVVVHSRKQPANAIRLTHNASSAIWRPLDVTVVQINCHVNPVKALEPNELTAVSLHWPVLDRVRFGGRNVSTKTGWRSSSRVNTAKLQSVSALCLPLVNRASSNFASMTERISVCRKI